MIIHFLAFCFVFNIYSSYSDNIKDQKERTISNLLDNPEEGEIDQIKKIIYEISKQGKDYKGPESLEFFYLELIKHCYKNNLKKVKQLLDLGLDVNISWMEEDDDNRHMVLIKSAVMVGGYNIVKYLFSKKAITIFPGDTEESLLIDAVNSCLKLAKKTAILNYQQKADIYSENRLKLTKFLLDHQVDRETESDEETAFRFAVNQGDLKLVQMFIFYKIPWYGGSINEQKNVKKRELESQFGLNPKFFKITSISLNNKLLAIIQLLFIDQERALTSNLFSQINIGSNIRNTVRKIKKLFEAVEEGSSRSGNMTIVKKLKDYIKLGLVNKDNDSLIDIAIKNHDKKMVITLLGQNQDTYNCLLNKDWKQESAIERVIQNNCGQLDMIEFLVNLSYI